MSHKEKIFVAYRPVEGTKGLAYHLSLNYIDSKGNHFVIDGGPEVKIRGRGSLKHTLKEHLLSPPKNNKDSAFQRLVLHGQDSAKIITQKNNT